MPIFYKYIEFYSTTHFSDVQIDILLSKSFFMSHIHHTKLISNMKIDIVIIGTIIQAELANELQEQYIKNPPKRMTSE